jgi:beta-fructofuranosidase
MLVMKTLILSVIGAAFLGFAHGQSTSSASVEPLVPTGTPIAGNYAGPLRPQVHFSPPKVGI